MKTRVASNQSTATKPKPLTSNNIFTGLVVLAFASLSLLGILNHEMWLDELQAWNIARDSSSILDLSKNLKYEGHPLLWYLGLFLITRFTRNPVAMQFLHLIITTTVIYIFVKYSPFTRVQKVIFSFGYFPFYEYNLLSRNYSLGSLLIFCFCALYPIRKKSYIPLACIIFLLANTNIYSLIIGLCLTFTLIFERFFNKNITVNFKKLDLIISSFIVFCGIIISIIQIRPPSDYRFGPDVSLINSESIGRVAIAVVKSYLVIPNLFTYKFWNTSIFTEGKIAICLGVLLSLGLLIFAITLFTRKPVVLFLYSIGTLGMLSFMYLKYFGALRHSGHLYILFIACLWISSYYDDVDWVFVYVKDTPSPVRKFTRNISNFAAKYKNYVIMTILYINLAVGIFAFTMDLSIPFSATKEVANFIKSQPENNILAVADIDQGNYIGSPLSAYLNKQVYYAGSKASRWGSFVLWNKNRGYGTVNDAERLFQEIGKLLTLEKSNILLVIEGKLETCKPGEQEQLTVKSPLKFRSYCFKFENFSISELAKFTNNLIRDEREGFYVYLIQPQQK